MLNTTPPVARISNIGRDGLSAPVAQLVSSRAHRFPESRGARRWFHQYDNGCTLQALGLNLGSDTLVVSFHGALNRDKYQLPRFERFASLCKLKVNSLLFADPTLELSRDLQLGWYVGWKGASIYDSIAAQAAAIARKFGHRRLIFSGSSGGGYAALQVSARVSGSVALAFNPQTHIHGYHDDGNPETHAAERKFIEVAYPDAAPDGIWSINFEKDWTRDLGSEYSVLRKYNTPISNSVVYMNNVNDWHVEQHFRPFVETMQISGCSSRLTEVRYESAPGHRPPTFEEFAMGVGRAIEISDENAIGS